MRMKTTITFELESGIREQLAAICDRYNLSLEEAFTLFAAVFSHRQAAEGPRAPPPPAVIPQCSMDVTVTSAESSVFPTRCMALPTTVFLGFG